MMGNSLKVIIYLLFTPICTMGGVVCSSAGDEHGGTTVHSFASYFMTHLMTRSARARTFAWIITSICLAALRFITNSNLMGCSTGISAGLAPLSILSTYMAARRNCSV